jgi:integrase
MRARGSEARGAVDPIAGEPWPSGSAASHKVARLRAAAIAAGVPGIEEVGPRKLVAYSSRHAYASEASSLGFSDEQVSEQLGNSAVVLRKVYAHSVEGAAAERAARISEGRRRVVGRGGKAKPAG